MRRLSLLVLALLSIPSPSVRAQPFFFGAADAPAEYVAAAWWQQRRSAEFGGGVSLIGPQWRGAGSLRLDYARPRVSARVGGTFRAGPLGIYRPDVDEPYDALRLVQYARYDPAPGGHLYARVGPVQNLRLDTGLLVNFFSSQTAWDRRTTGAEVALRHPALTVDAFVEDVRANKLVGGAVGIEPFAALGPSMLSGLRLSGSYVHDLSARRGRREGFGATASIDLVRGGGFEIRPYLSGASIAQHGEGLALGVMLENPRLLDLARVQGRVAVTYSGDAFLPGYFGTFFTVRNPGARLLDSAQYLSELQREDTLGVTLDEVDGGSGFITEFRLVLFQQFEFWHAFYRHYGSQALSSYHLRLYFRQPEGVEVSLGIDRDGLRSFLSLFNRFNDQSALVLTGRYPLFRSVIVGLDTRYTFERLSFDGTTERYIAQRRFEPYVALRVLL